MPEHRQTVDAVLKMAQATARRHAANPAPDKPDSPDLRLAIARVWDQVKGRLPASQASELDALVQSITARKDRA